MISLDTETTGGDFRHGARPYFVTSCGPDGAVTWWEWDVDPLTRGVAVPRADLAEVWRLVRGAERIVGQNLKFDVHALASVLGVGPEDFPWGKVEDTLVAGHVLASNKPHNLTDMAVQYLGVDVQPFEDRLHEACESARRWCRSHEPDWAIAKAGRDDMPSAREKCWKLDGWLPRALVERWWEDSEAGQAWAGRPQVKSLFKGGDVKRLPGWEYRPPGVEGGDHPWWTVLRDYANADSEVTAVLWKKMEGELRRRNLWRIYRARMAVVPAVARMEARGVTGSVRRVEGLLERYQKESEAAGRLCVDIAASEGFALEVPRGGNNKSLRTFLLDVLKLPTSKRSEKTGEPSLDRSVMEDFEHLLPPRSPGGTFVRTLKAKRKRDTSVNYLLGYRRFWLPAGGTGDWFRLHTSVNPTGTDTLRMSSTNPNSQNIAKQDVECHHCRGEGCVRCAGSGKDLWSLRHCFGPLPGREWWSLDAKNIELRLPAYLAGERHLIELFERPDDPPYYGSNHLLNFHTVYPDIWEMELKAVGPERVGPHVKKKYASTWYQSDKNGWFSKQYGGGRAKVDATFRRAGSYDLLDRKLANLARLNAETIAFAERHGYVETIPVRSVDPERGYPLLCTRTEHGRVLSTVPLNYKIQGSAMDWTARATVKSQDRLDRWHDGDGFDGFITLQVHDELVFDFPKVGDPVAEARGEAPPRSSNLWRIREVQALMESCGQDFVPPIPTPVGVEYHADNWSEGVTL